MKNAGFNKRIIIILIIAIIALVGLGVLTYNIINDENKLSVEEKEWITENINIVQNVYVRNDLDVFGKNGSGVFYDFLSSVESEYEIQINRITYGIGEESKDNAFKVVYDIEEDDVVFYKEHYVVISKDKKNISSISQLNNKKIGVLSADEKTINKYLGATGNTIINKYLRLYTKSI